LIGRDFDLNSNLFVPLEVVAHAPQKLLLTLNELKLSGVFIDIKVGELSSMVVVGTLN
jgi:hypothetical protein